MMKEEFMNMKKLYHYTKFDTAIKILELKYWNPIV